MKRRDLIKGAATVIPGAIALQMFGRQVGIRRRRRLQRASRRPQLRADPGVSRSRILPPGQQRQPAQRKGRALPPCDSEGRRGACRRPHGHHQEPGEPLRSPPRRSTSVAPSRPETAIWRPRTRSRTSESRPTSARPHPVQGEGTAAAAASIFGVEARHAAILGCLPEEGRRRGLQRPVREPATPGHGAQGRQPVHRDGADPLVGRVPTPRGQGRRNPADHPSLPRRRPTSAGACGVLVEKEPS